MKFPRGKVKSRNNRGVRNKGRGFTITCYKQRTESQNDTTTVDSKTRWPDRCARQETHAWRLGQRKQTQEQNHTEMLREQFLGCRDSMQIIIKIKTHGIITTKKVTPKTHTLDLLG